MADYKDYRAEINVMLKRAILDPQGRAVETTLRRLGTTNLSDVRIGKRIELQLSGERAEVEAQLEGLIERVLSNPVMEEATYTLTELTSTGSDCTGSDRTGSNRTGSDNTELESIPD